MAMSRSLFIASVFGNKWDLASVRGKPLRLPFGEKLIREEGR